MLIAFGTLLLRGSEIRGWFRALTRLLRHCPLECVHSLFPQCIPQSRISMQGWGLCVVLCVWGEWGGGGFRGVLLFLASCKFRVRDLPPRRCGSTPADCFTAVFHVHNSTGLVWDQLGSRGRMQVQRTGPVRQGSLQGAGCWGSPPSGWFHSVQRRF